VYKNQTAFTINLFSPSASSISFRLSLFRTEVGSIIVAIREAGKPTRDFPVDITQKPEGCGRREYPACVTMETEQINVFFCFALLSLQTQQREGGGAEGFSIIYQHVHINLTLQLLLRTLAP